MNFKPLSDRIVVRLASELEQSKGGIFIPQAAREKPIEGTVVAVGPGKYLDSGTFVAVTLQVGDTVLFGRHSGTELALADELFLVLREDEILGKKLPNA